MYKISEELLKEVQKSLIDLVKITAICTEEAPDNIGKDEIAEGSRLVKLIEDNYLNIPS